MSSQLPVQIDPIRLAEEGARLCGALSGNKMSRLQELTLLADQPVTVDLQFERTAENGHWMRGTIRTQVEMTCGRCLKPLKMEIVAQPNCAVLRPGEAEPEEGETLIADGLLSLIELVEDELLLAMPMIPGHPEGECELAVPINTDKVSVTERKTNPFADLRGFKDKHQDQ
jgi:uncharacterized protein